MVTICWLRNELRLHDNATLIRALQAATEFLPVYVVEDKLAQLQAPGVQRMGAFRQTFLYQSLEDLRNSLRQLGSDLLVLEGKPEECLGELVRQTGAQLLVCTAEWAPEEQAAEAAVETVLRTLGCALVRVENNGLYSQRELPFTISALPELFTEFRRKVEHAVRVGKPLPAPDRLPPLPEKAKPEIGSLAPSDAEPEPVSDPRGVLSFKGGETEGLRRLKHYLWDSEQVRRYKLTRNEMLGPDFSSKFSAWLALGCLSPRQIVHELQLFEQQVVRNESTYWLFFELLWREYFRWLMAKYGVALFRPGGIRGLELEWTQDEDQFERWRLGQTGIPLVDACMRELLLTGYLSNRGRQNVASFLTKNLGIDWRWGAAWFECQLIDYDVYANYGNWTYSAGVGNDARDFRYFNIPVQADKYDREGRYVRHWLPELAALPNSHIHQPWRLSRTQLRAYGVQLNHHYPEPMVDLERSVRVQEQRYLAALEATRWRKRGNAVTGKFVAESGD